MKEEKINLLKSEEMGGKKTFVKQKARNERKTG